MSTILGKVVSRRAQLQTVTRREAVVWANGRETSGGPDVAAQVKMRVQRESDRPIELDRLPDGDQTGGEVRVWVEVEDLAAAYVVDPMVPLGWTELQTAPPERAEGPPGDLIDFKGRRYEITERKGWSESSTITNDAAGFQRYVAQERGATP